MAACSTLNYPYDARKDYYWRPPFEEEQKALLYRTTSEQPMPLLVSLHTWSYDYRQYDGYSELAKAENWNFIHPNFRGTNTTPESCASPMAIQDVEDAITYAIETMNVDMENIFVVGTSGGCHTSCARI